MARPAPIALLLLLAAAAQTARCATAPVVPTENGFVSGVVVDGVNAYMGIPFAAPPVGELRFKPPQPLQSNWTGVLAADSYGAQCPQFHTALGHIGSEDCLTIDVAAPVDATPKSDANDENDANGANGASDDALLPVMVWIYGGGFALGSADEYGNYDLAPLARRGVVMVSFNYRLGPLGFLGADALMSESGTAGNYGTLDQTAALRWVQRNIAAFGGDPARVTIFGESAGAFSVCWHLASPSSAGLFRAAIMESGSCDSTSLFQSAADAATLARNYGDDVGCPSSLGDVDWRECMRARSVDELLNSNFTNIRLGGVPPSFYGPGKYVPSFAPVFTFGPVVDGKALPRLPLDAIRAGDFNRVPLLIGTNLNECTLFVDFLYVVMRGLHWPLRESDAALALGHFFNASVVPQALALYPSANYKSEFYRMADLMTDFTFACGTRRIMRAVEAAGQPVYGYTFAYKGDFVQDAFLGDYHSSELAFVFDHSSLLGLFSKRDSEMADIFGTYWTNHAKSLSPNGPARVPLQWPQYHASGAANESEIVLKLPPGTERGYRDSFCDFWDTVQPLDS